MKSSSQYLFLFFILLVCLQSVTAYPSSYTQTQRGYLLCQLSAVSCKRSLFDTDQMENSTEMNFDDYFQMCIALQKPILHCLDEVSQKRNEMYSKN